MEKIKSSIFWFRRDLRLYDNHALFKSLMESQVVIPLFIFDTDILETLPTTGYDRRVDFIYSALCRIDKDLKIAGSALFTAKGKPVDVFAKLIDHFCIDTVYCNNDYEVYANTRDNAVSALLESRGIGFKSYKDQVIFEKDEIVKENAKPYTVYTPYSKKWIESYHSLAIYNIGGYTSELLTHKFIKLSGNRFSDLPSDIFSKVISIDSLGFSHSVIEIEKSGLPDSLMKSSLEPSVIYPLIDNYEKTRNNPGIDGTSYLSHHLRFGTVSIRELVKIAWYRDKTYLKELIWREFFKMFLFHFPYVESMPFNKKYVSIKWENNLEHFERWCTGKTGYPMVDAGMRQLNTTGYMHNRVRMVAASFLSKHLLIDWRLGEGYFAQKLLDYDLSSNNGNWQWAAGCGCDAAPYFRVFNPYEQQKRFDPHFLYIKRWVPEFNSESYPPPMVEHRAARLRLLSVYKEALKNG